MRKYLQGKPTYIVQCSFLGFFGFRCFLLSSQNAAFSFFFSFFLFLIVNSGKRVCVRREFPSKSLWGNAGQEDGGNLKASHEA